MSQGTSLSSDNIRVYGSLMFLTIACCILASITNEFFLLLAPFALVGLALTIVDYKNIFYGFFLLIPFSVELYLPGGLGTDLPSEPMMWLLLIVTFFVFVWNAKSIPQKLLTNKVSLIIILQLIWILITSLNSTFPIVSFKFFLAKLWYVIPFFFLPLLIIKKTNQLELIFKLFTFSTVIALTYVMIRHAGLGFSFAEINTAVRPIFRNHVNYAAMLVMIVPFIWALAQIKGSKKYWAVLFYILLGIYLTYTRAAYGVIFLCIPMYFIIKFQLVRWVTPVAVVGVLALVLTLVRGNEYLELAPDYERTITHKKFNNLIEATYKMEDISTMERLHRWVAGFQMLDDHPVLGFGPATFFNNYQSHTVSSFKTYVSDNPEKSGIHNYYLMTLVEQGFVGLLLLIALFLVPMLIAEKTYHQYRGTEHGYWIMASILSYFCLIVLVTINDLLEVDKVGPLFYFCASILVLYSLNLLGNNNQMINR